MNQYIAQCCATARGCSICYIKRIEVIKVLSLSRSPYKLSLQLAFHPRLVVTGGTAILFIFCSITAWKNFFQIVMSFATGRAGIHHFLTWLLNPPGALLICTNWLLLMKNTQRLDWSQRWCAVLWEAESISFLCTLWARCFPTGTSPVLHCAGGEPRPGFWIVQFPMMTLWW